MIPTYHPDQHPVTGRVVGTDCWLHVICSNCGSRRIVNARDFVGIEEER